MARALGHRNYRLFAGGQLVSLIGTWMQSVAQAWLVYRLTGSSLLLGSVTFATQIPVFLLAPLGGALADRRSRQRVLLATQSAAMVLALTLAALTLTGRVQIPHLFAIGAALGVVNAFDVPARQALVAELVGREDLPNAIALNSSMVNGARIVGPAVAGVLVGAIGEGFCFLANGLSFLAVIAGLSAMRLPARPIAARRGGALADIGEGFRFVARTPAVRSILLLLGLMSLTTMPHVVLMPIFADRILDGGPRGLGLLMGASGLGAITGALTLAARADVRRMPAWVAAACATYGAALVLFAQSRSFWLSALLLVPAGFTMLVQMAGSNTLVQSMVPDALRGRVMAIYSMTFIGMAPLGALFGGWLAARIGAPATVTAGGACCILGATVFAALLPPRARVDARHVVFFGFAPPPPPPPPPPPTPPRLTVGPAAEAIVRVPRREDAG